MDQPAFAQNIEVGIKYYRVSFGAAAIHADDSATSAPVGECLETCLSSFSGDHTSGNEGSASGWTIRLPILGKRGFIMETKRFYYYNNPH